MADITWDKAVKVVERIRDWPLGDRNMTECTVADYYAIAPADRPAELRLALHFSEENGAAWDAVNIIAQQHLRSGPMPRELAEWIADRLEGKRKRPTKRGLSPDTNAVRDMLIASAVQALVNRGFRPTRNTASGSGYASEEGGSACDAVGVAFGMGHKAVEKVWNNSKPPTGEISAREFLQPFIDHLFACYEMPRNK